MLDFQPEGHVFRQAEDHVVFLAGEHSQAVDVRTVPVGSDDAHADIIPLITLEVATVHNLVIAEIVAGAVAVLFIGQDALKNLCRRRADDLAHRGAYL